MDNSWYNCYYIYLLKPRCGADTFTYAHTQKFLLIYFSFTKKDNVLNILQNPAVALIRHHYIHFLPLHPILILGDSHPVMN